MGGVVVRGVPWVLTAIGAAWGIKSVGDGIGEGTKTALMIVGAGAAAYLILKRGK